ncbi:MAG: glycoside hydrolase family 3 C-terminal domain-containing protein [Clostridiales bacterium]|nr:glycoside hydrolase family 3 C-terminal domain-containing protein [Clostridiales bacterium]
MSLEDKIAICSGKNFWETKEFEKYGIPSLFMCDGPHGLRKQEMERGVDMLGINNSVPSTCFPSNVTSSSSWNPELMEEIGSAIAEEAIDQNVGMVLGPGANIKRNPLCGRNFEYMSEDPVLAGKLAAGFIRGIESKGVSSSLKHFAGNSQEYYRFVSDSIMDDRTMREIYLTAFEIAVKEGKPSTIMCAYPKLNGIHCSDHKELLGDILRDEWGFEGMVVTDWGAMNDRIQAFRSGCDLNMPGGSEYMEKDALKAVKSGELSEEDINACAERVIRLALKAEKTLKNKQACDYEAHHKLAKRAACEGAVLLKNEDGILPLKEDEKVAVVGHIAKQMRFQGAGSSHINAKKVSQPMDYLPNAIFAEGCDVNGDTSEEMLAEAEKAAKEANVVVVFAGLPERYESEGFDRSDMRLPDGHNRLIDRVLNTNPNTIVVLFCGAPVECQWKDKAKAVVYMGLPGQAGGEAVADILFGKVNPSGKLSESWPEKYEDCVSSDYFAKTKDALYLEGIYCGYRYYDKAGKELSWPFGYGLSYTSFEYSNLTVDGDNVSVNVKNTGNRAGCETVQLYIESRQDTIHRPIRELRHFEKIYLEKGETKTVRFVLSDRDFSLWQSGWCVQEGEYSVCVGSNSRNLPLKQLIHRTGDVLFVPEWQNGSFYENCKGQPDLEVFEKMLGRKYAPLEVKKGSFTMDSTVKEMKEYSLIMRIMNKAIEKVVAKGCGGKVDYNNPEFRMIMSSVVEGPMRSLMISGGMKGGVIPGMLEMANGHLFKGIIRMIKG